MGFAVLALVWMFGGAWLPGGRWFAVHLLTLGVLTNLVFGFSEHFARTLTRTLDRPARSWPRPAIVTVGVGLVLWGITIASVPIMVAGTTVVGGVTVHAWWRLRQMRRSAIGARFAWIVRTYEHSHVALLVGIVLGALLGSGTLRGAGWVAGRRAHVHVNMLGWIGLTLLATIVFFGPTLVRQRIEDGADVSAARALRYATAGVAIAVVLLLAEGAASGSAAMTIRLSAALALSVHAWAVTVVCLPVTRVAMAARDSASRWFVVAAPLWFIAVVWADVIAIAFRQDAWLNAIGLAFLLGVAVQTVLATLLHLAPALFADQRSRHDRLRDGLAANATARAVVANVAIGVVVITALGGKTLGGAGAFLTRGAWLTIAAAVLHLLVASALATRRSPIPANS